MVNQYFAHSFNRNWQQLLPFLNQRKGENDSRKYFMIKSPKRVLPTRRDSNPQPPDHQSDASNQATEAGRHWDDSNEYTQHTIISKEDRQDIFKLFPFASWPGAKINPERLELPLSRTNFHVPPPPSTQTAHIAVAKSSFQMNIFLIYPQKNLYCRYSLEVPQRGTSNEYLQHMFLWINKKTIINFWLTKMLSLELSSE